MNKKKLILLSITLATLTLSTVAAITLSSNSQLLAQNRDVPTSAYQLDLDEHNQINDIDGSVETNLGNKVYFATEGKVTLDPSGAWTKFDFEGEDTSASIYNTSAIKGMKSIVIDSTGSLYQLHYGSLIEGRICYSNEVAIDSTHFEYTFPTGYEPSYIKIYVSGYRSTTTIDNITINYSCSETSVVYTHSDFFDFELINEGASYQLNGYRLENYIPVGIYLEDLVVPVTYNSLPVTHIKDEAFKGMSPLKSLSFFEGLLYIGSKAFYNCSSVEVVNLPGSVETAFDAFLFCGDLSTVTVKADQTEVDLDAYRANSLLETINVEAGNSKYYSVDGVLYQYNYNYNNTLLYCPSKKEGSLSVYEDCEVILEDAFKNSRLSEINIGENVGAILENFNSCARLENVYINNNNNYLDDQNGIPFSKQSHELISYPRHRSETSLTLHNDIYLLRDNAFKGVSNIEALVLTSVSSIGDYALMNMANLEEVTFADGLSSLGVGAFKNDVKLESVTLPITLEHIKDETFYGCSLLGSVGLPSYLEDIGNRAFYNCVALSSISYPSLQFSSIGEEAFRGCSALAVNLIIPDSVASIGNGAFRESGIINFSLSHNMSVIPDSCFRDCDSLTHIVIPAWVRTIKQYAFYSCSHIKEIDIKDGVTTIEKEAFRDCPVHYQFIPSTVTSLGAFAFDFNTNDRRFYTPYNIIAYNDESVPSGWSKYFGGNSYSVEVINGGMNSGCSRSTYEDLVEQYHWFDD